MSIRRYLLLLLIILISVASKPAFAADPGDDPDKKTDLRRSDSELDLLLDVLSYLEGEHFPVYVQLTNTSTASGGPFDITGVVREITLPAGLQFVNTTADSFSSCFFEGNTGTCTSTSFPANGQATSVFYVSSTQSGPKTITGTKTQNEFDPDLNNNLASVTVTIVEVPDGSISGVVFEDLNGNGIKDAGETAEAGVTVALSGTSTGSAVTDSGGAYSFSNLAEGDYTVTVQTGTYNGGTEARPWHPSAPETGSHSISLAAGQAYSGADFLIWQESIVIITAFHDINANPNDSWDGRYVGGLGIYRIDDCFAEIGAEVLTGNLNGYAVFGGLAPGNYCFRVNQNNTFPGGTNGTAILLSAPPEEDGIRQVLITVTSGSEKTGSFGVYTHGKITGNKFSDVDGDGMVESADTGLAGWTIELKDNEGTPVGTTVTAADGSYEFTEVLPGNYEVTEVL